MKKILLLLLLLTAGLTACSGNEPGEYTHDEPGEPAYIVPISQGNQVRFGDTLITAYCAEEVADRSFDVWLYIPHPAIEGVDIQGDDILIAATQAIYNPSLILIESDFDDVYNEDIFTVTAEFEITNTGVLEVGEAIVINGYVSMGTLPWSGITFADAQGEQYFLAINHDNSDSPNRFLLLDITPQVRGG